MATMATTVMGTKRVGISTEDDGALCRVDENDEMTMMMSIQRKWKRKHFRHAMKCIVKKAESQREEDTRTNENAAVTAAVCASP